MSELKNIHEIADDDTETKTDVVPELGDLLSEAEAILRRHVALTDAQYVAEVLWIAHTFVYEQFGYTPYLGILAPEHGSGKTINRKLVGKMSFGSWPIALATPATVFRTIDARRPRITLMVEEIGTVFGPDSEHSELRSVFTSGNESGVLIPRMGGPQKDVLLEFDPFCPKLFCGIGLKVLPRDLRSRTVAIEMQRKRAEEEIVRLRRKEERVTFARCLEVASGLEAWATKVDLYDVEPDVPAEITNDRSYDNWEVLIAVADAAGGEWPSRARHAAVVIETNTVTSDDSEGIQLLWAIRQAFVTSGLDRRSTDSLMAAVCSNEELPFRGWWWDARENAPTKGAVAKFSALLRNYKIKSRSIRLPDGTTPKGYKREQFEDAWERNLDPSLSPSGENPPQPPQPSNDEGLRLFSEPPQGQVVAAPGNGANPVPTRVVAVVADLGPTGRDGGQDGAPELTENEAAFLAECDELVAEGRARWIVGLS